MRRITTLGLLLGTAGCSNAPVVDLLDYFKPGRLPEMHAPPYGGVGPAGGVIGVAEVVAEPPPAPPPPPLYQPVPAPMPPTGHPGTPGPY
jgi:hypothetical protein